MDKMEYTNLFDYKKSEEPKSKKTVLKVKKSNGDGEEPKKVEKAPEGFAVLKKEGNRTYYKKVTTKMPPVKFEPAVTRIPGRGGSEREKMEYFNKMVDMVKSGINPDDLVTKKYIDPTTAVKLKPYFKPQTIEEIVYTEEPMKTEPTPPKPKPITAYEGEHFFDPSGKAVGKAILNTRDSKDFAAQQGEVSPTGQDVWFAFYKPNSTEIDESKGMFKIPAGVWGNKITKGVKTIFDPAELQKYKYTPNASTEKMAAEVKPEMTRPNIAY